jgi:multiple sugar transport system permease protein
MSTIETTTPAPPPGEPLPQYTPIASVVSTMEGLSRKGSARPFRSSVTLHIVLVTMSVLMMLPLLWMILTSLKTLDEVNSTSWIPRHVNWHDYRDIFKNYKEVFKEVAFGRFYWNSVYVAAWTTFLQVLTSAMAAFSFARLKWPGRDKVFVLYLSTMMLPGLVMMIPNYQIMMDLHLLDSFAGLIIPAAFSAFGTFLLRQFMMSIPSSLDEAAEIDGAGKWRLFWDIILPLSRPGLIALTIFTFMGNYNSFFWPQVMMKSVNKYTLPIGMLYFDSSQGTSTHLLMAAAIMSILPMIIIFAVLQKYLVKGIQLGAVKG